MKLVHPDIEKQIVFKNTYAFECIIESPELFSQYVQELNEQSYGREGAFILSYEEKELDISKNVELILNPFAIDLNDKRILKKIYTDLTELAYAEPFYNKTQEVKNELQQYFYLLEQEYDCILDANEEIEVSNLLKAMNVRIMNEAGNLLDNLSLYIKLSSLLLHKKLIILINIRSYIDIYSLEELIKTAEHNNISLLFIENMQRCFSTKCSYCIIDKDGCLIY